MKTLKFVVAALVLASSVAARAEVSAQAWLETYYLNPQPAKLVKEVRALSREGYFEKPGHTSLAIGFLGTVFQQNPQWVDSWIVELNGLPVRHQRIVAAALWEAGHPMGTVLLQKLGQQTVMAAEIQELTAKSAVSIADTPVLSTASMNLQWGAFVASGDEHFVVNILDGIGSDRPGLSSAARYAIAQNAAAHPRVMEICRAQLEKQPNEVQSALRAALNDAAAGRNVPRT